MFARSLLALSLTLAVASPAPAEPEKPPLPQNRQEWAVAARLTFAGARPLPDSVKGVAGSLRTVVRIEIRRDGSIADVRIEKSSGFGPADEAALKMARDAGSLPPLPADIPGETHAATLPLIMTLAPTDEADRRLYVHTDLGLRIETPPPFLLDPLPNNPRLTAGVQVTAAGAPPPYAAPNEPLCLVGFKNADDPSRTQEGLNEDASVDRALAVQTRAAEANSLAVDRTSVTDYRGSKLIELFQTPRAGAPGWSDSEFYVAMFERPSGAYAITCVAAKGRMAEALPTFQTIRDGAGMIEAASAPPR